MTKQELYVELCKEAGTYGAAPKTTPTEWYEMCSHNIHRGLDDDLQLAANGDVRALIDVRACCGLPPLV